MEMTLTQREMARHALGLPNRKNTCNRNHYCIGSGGEGYEDWVDMVANGLAVKRTRSFDGGDDTFHMTLNGALMVRENNEHLSREDAANMRAWKSELEALKP